MDQSSTPRLLIVGPCRHSTGGIAQYIEGQTQALDDEFEVATHSTSSPPGKLAARGKPIRHSLWFLLAILWATGQFIRLPFRARPDVVHIHAASRLSFYRAALYLFYAGAVWDSPTVLHIHGADFDEFLRHSGRIRRWFVKRTLGAADAVVVLSEYWQNVVAPMVDKGEITVLPNPVNVDAYDPEFDDDPVRIVYLSNLVKRKGVEEFVESVERLNETTTTEYEVVVAGRGPKSGDVAGLAEEYDHVEYRGYVTESEKLDLLSRGSIYVLPSAAEGLPFSLLEGMAGGNAIVSTAVGSIPEVVGESNGVLISPIDVDELTEGLKSLVENDGRRQNMARANYELVANEYSWTSIAAELRSLYSRLMADQYR